MTRKKYFLKPVPHLVYLLQAGGRLELGARPDLMSIQGADRLKSGKKELRLADGTMVGSPTWVIGPRIFREGGDRGPNRKSAFKIEKKW